MGALDPTRDGNCPDVGLWPLKEIWVGWRRIWLRTCWCFGFWALYKLENEMVVCMDREERREYMIATSLQMSLDEDFDR